jgi:hypothetical protein
MVEDLPLEDEDGGHALAHALWPLPMSLHSLRNKKLFVPDGANRPKTERWDIENRSRS